MMTERQEKIIVDNNFEIVEDDKPDLCIDCPLNRVCKDAFKCEGKLTKKKMETIKCHYELIGDYDKKRQLFVKWQAFADTDPKYFIEKMMVTYDILEDEAKKDFNFAKGMQLLYLQMAIYKMKFGEKQVNENRQINASVDIQKLLDKVRDE